MTIAPSSRASGRSGSGRPAELGRMIVSGRLGASHLDVLPLDLLALDPGRIAILILEWSLPALDIGLHCTGAAGKAKTTSSAGIVVSLDRIDLQWARRIWLAGGLDFQDAGASNFTPWASTVCFGSSAPDQEQDGQRQRSTPECDAAKLA